MNRAEIIAALVTDKYSGFKDGDEAILEACSDERLKEFQVASDARKVDAAAKTKLETDLRNTGARLKVAEDKLKASEAAFSEEEFLARAPESIKALIEEHKTEEAQFRASLISSLKDLGVKTEDELKKASTEELKTLAAFARVEVPDYSGRVLAKDRNAEHSTKTYAAPDPYAADLDRMRKAARQ